MLGKGEQVDVDMVCSRYIAEQSAILKQNIRSGALRVIMKDDHRGTVQIKTAEYAPPPPPMVHKQDNSDVIDAVKQLEAKLEKRLEEKVTAAQQQQPQIDPALLSQALAAIQGLVNQAGKAVPSKEENPSEEVSERVVDIHKRTLDRLAGNAQSNVKHTEQISDNSSVQKNIDELEGLL